MQWLNGAYNLAEATDGEEVAVLLPCSYDMWSIVLRCSSVAVECRVMVDDSGKHPVRKSAPDAADAIFKAMFSQASSSFFFHLI